jgi:hypothetical protein
LFLPFSPPPAPKHSTKPTSTSSQHTALILPPQHCPPLAPRPAPGAAGPSQAALLPVSTEPWPRSRPQPTTRCTESSQRPTVAQSCPARTQQQPNHTTESVHPAAAGPWPGAAWASSAPGLPGAPQPWMFYSYRGAHAAVPHTTGAARRPCSQPTRKARRQLQGPSAVI